MGELVNIKDVKEDLKWYRAKAKGLEKRFNDKKLKVACEGCSEEIEISSTEIVAFIKSGKIIYCDDCKIADTKFDEWYDKKMIEVMEIINSEYLKKRETAFEEIRQRKIREERDE